MVLGKWMKMCNFVFCTKQNRTSMEQYQVESIAPYTDEEAVVALGKIANHPSVPWISKYIFS